MEDRILKILRAKKIKGVNWDDIAEKLPIGSNGLRAAFSRGSVDPVYLDIIEGYLGINTPSISISTQASKHEDVQKKTIDSIIKRQIEEIVNSKLENIYDKLNEVERDVSVLIEKQLLHDIGENKKDDSDIKLSDSGS